MINFILGYWRMISSLALIKFIFSKDKCNSRKSSTIENLFCCRECLFITLLYRQFSVDIKLENFRIDSCFVGSRGLSPLPAKHRFFTVLSADYYLYYDTIHVFSICHNRFESRINNWDSEPYWKWYYFDIVILFYR